MSPAIKEPQVAPSLLVDCFVSVKRIPERLEAKMIKEISKKSMVFSLIKPMPRKGIFQSPARKEYAMANATIDNIVDVKIFGLLIVSKMYEIRLLAGFL